MRLFGLWRFAVAFPEFQPFRFLLALLHYIGTNLYHCIIFCLSPASRLLCTTCS